MALTGIKVRNSDGRWVFVGKVGRCPEYHALPMLKGQVIMYREGQECDNADSAHGTHDIDVAAWQEAARRGAKFMVTYCTDTKCLVVSRKSVVEASPAINHGNTTEYRIPLEQSFTLRHALRIQMWWTDAIIKVGDERATHAA